MTILIVENDAALASFLTSCLGREGYKVKVVADAAAALETFRNECPNLTLINLGLSGGDGLLREMHSGNEASAIMILTADRSASVHARCLDAGADDVVSMPFSPLELRARCRALLRRTRDFQNVLVIGDVVIDRVEHSLTVGTHPVVMTKREYMLIEYLATRRGHVVRRAELLIDCWGGTPPVTAGMVDVYIAYLRRKLKAAGAPNLIQTVRGEGFAIARETALCLAS